MSSSTTPTTPQTAQISCWPCSIRRPLDDDTLSQDHNSEPSVFCDASQVEVHIIVGLADLVFLGAHLSDAVDVLKKRTRCYIQHPTCHRRRFLTQALIDAWQRDHPHHPPGVVSLALPAPYKGLVYVEYDTESLTVTCIDEAYPSATAADESPITPPPTYRPNRTRLVLNNLADRLQVDIAHGAPELQPPY